MSIALIILIHLGCLLLSYLIGSIPHGVIITYLVKKIDIRREGSHNSGGTNVARVLGAKYGIITILLDAFKIVIPFWLANIFLPLIPGFASYVPNLLYMMMIVSCIGHCWPLYCKFQGGKAVSTFLGCIMATNYVLLIIGAIIFFIILKLTKQVSAASIVTSMTMLTLSLLFLGLGIPFIGVWPGLSYSIIYPVALLVGTVLIIFRHTMNIHRITDGKESKIRWM